MMETCVYGGVTGGRQPEPSALQWNVTWRGNQQSHDPHSVAYTTLLPIDTSEILLQSLTSQYSAVFLCHTIELIHDYQLLHKEKVLQYIATLLIELCEL